jgi:hypothetical protein
LGFGWLGPFKVTGGRGQQKAVDTWNLETTLAALAPPKPKGLFLFFFFLMGLSPLQPGKSSVDIDALETLPMDLNDAETAYHQAAAALHGEVVNLESGSSGSDGKKALEKNN